MTDFRNKYSVLQDFFGHSQFRNGQEQIIDSILAGRDCLGVMPTGAGKSMCYQIPALMFDGITIVVSPLISLMKDQVNSLIQSGVRAAYLNSSLTAAQYEMAISNAARGMYKIIYVAPERHDDRIVSVTGFVGEDIHACGGRSPLRFSVGTGFQTFLYEDTRVSWQTSLPPYRQRIHRHCHRRSKSGHYQNA